MDDSAFERFHCLFMFFLPNKGRAFVSEINKWLSDGGEVLDPYVYVAGDAEEGVDVREVFAVRPVADFGDLGVVGNAAFVIALVS